MISICFRCDDIASRPRANAYKRYARNMCPPIRQFLRILRQAPNQVRFPPILPQGLSSDLNYARDGQIRSEELDKRSQSYQRAWRRPNWTLGGG